MPGRSRAAKASASARPAIVLALGHLASVSIHGDVSQVTVAVLELLDIVLLANLVLIVVFAGYESFVSRMEVARVSRDRPEWMGRSITRR